LQILENTPQKRNILHALLNQEDASTRKDKDLFSFCQDVKIHGTITSRIQRMNKRLKTELGKPVAESYSRRWILTSFVQKCITSPREDVEREIRQQKEEY